MHRTDTVWQCGSKNMPSLQNGTCLQKIRWLQKWPGLLKLKKRQKPPHITSKYQAWSYQRYKHMRPGCCFSQRNHHIFFCRFSLDDFLPAMRHAITRGDRSCMDFYAESASPTFLTKEEIEQHDMVIRYLVWWPNKATYDYVRDKFK